MNIQSLNKSMAALLVASLISNGASAMAMDVAGEAANAIIPAVKTQAAALAANATNTAVPTVANNAIAPVAAKVVAPVSRWTLSNAWNTTKNLGSAIVSGTRTGYNSAINGTYGLNAAKDLAVNNPVATAVAAATCFGVASYLGYKKLSPENKQKLKSAMPSKKNAIKGLAATGSAGLVGYGVWQREQVVNAAQSLWSSIPTQAIKDACVTGYETAKQTALNNPKTAIAASTVLGAAAVFGGYKGAKAINAKRTARIAAKPITIDLMNKGLTNETVVTELAKVVTPENRNQVVLIKLNINNVTEVSQELVTFLAQLPNLEKIWLGQNQITQLPANLFERLPQVKVFGFANNQLTTLPQEIVDVQRSTQPKQLRLVGNPLPAELFALATIK